jgi:hypothetical protein
MGSKKTEISASRTNPSAQVLPKLARRVASGEQDRGEDSEAAGHRGGKGSALWSRAIQKLRHTLEIELFPVTPLKKVSIFEKTQNKPYRSV